MDFYRNIIAVGYKYYSKSIVDPYVGSISLVALSQILTVGMLLTIFYSISGIDIILWIPNKYYVVLIVIIWLLLLYKYYDTEKVKKAVENFDKKSKIQKLFWGILTVLSAALPMLIIIIMSID